MSIFSDFKDKMYNAFSVDFCYFKNCKASEGDAIGYTTRARMLGPRDRGILDYVVTENKIDCYVGDKRRWVSYIEIFDINIRKLEDIIRFAGLDGEFDIALPLTEPDEVITDTENHGYGPYWSTSPFISLAKYSTYWNIVASHMEQNIKRHIWSECSADVHCTSIDNGYLSDVNRFKVEITINSINNEECFWCDMDKTKLWASSRPTIIFFLRLHRKHSNTDNDVFI
jgi:hypothetical protein